MREMSVTEQRYKAFEAVVAQGQTITQVARDWGVSRQTIHGWLAKYVLIRLKHDKSVPPDACRGFG